MSPSAAIALLAGGCFICALAVLCLTFSSRVDETLADIDAEPPAPPGDDWMDLADAVQDTEPPLFVDEYLQARDFQLWSIEAGWEM